MITEETISRVKSSLQATKSFLALEVIERLEKENEELKASLEEKINFYNKQGFKKISEIERFEKENAELKEYYQKKLKDEENAINRIVELAKENEKLKYNLKCRDDELAESKAEIKQIIERERVVPEHYLCEMIEKNKELKAENKTILEDNDTLNKWVDELKEQVESMKKTLIEISEYADEKPIHNIAQNELEKWELAE